MTSPRANLLSLTSGKGWGLEGTHQSSKNTGNRKWAEIPGFPSSLLVECYGMKRKLRKNYPACYVGRNGYTVNKSPKLSNHWWEERCIFKRYGRRALGPWFTFIFPTILQGKHQPSQFTKQQTEAVNEDTSEFSWLLATDQALRAALSDSLLATGHTGKLQSQRTGFIGSSFLYVFLWVTCYFGRCRRAERACKGTISEVSV